MFWLLPLLCYFAQHTQSSVARSVTFVNSMSSAFSTRQVCSSRGYSDICCEPLCLDLKNGNGHCWFRAGPVTSAHIESPNAITVILGQLSQCACSSDIIAQRHSSRSGGAGSTAVNDLSADIPLFEKSSIYPLGGVLAILRVTLIG